MSEIPTLRSRLDAQLAAEKLQVLNKSGVDGVTLLIAEGIELDMTQYVIFHSSYSSNLIQSSQKLCHLASIKRISKRQAQQLQHARYKYSTQLAQFSESMASFFLLTVAVIQDLNKSNHDTDNSTKPEASPIYLPSTFTQAEHKACNLSDAALIERELREGLANDQLEEVCC
uniref:Uncharacterized protein n=1 Tax=Moniliophthora roreri TaxID=221103 RepID=A0A0W0FI09_MONRR